MEWIIRSAGGIDTVLSSKTQTLETSGLVIGSSAKADFRLADPSVADNHARLHLGKIGKDALSIEDLGSGRPTIVNGQHLRMPYEQMPLGVGSRIMIGQIELEVLARRNTGTGSTRPVPPDAKPPPLPPDAAIGTPWDELEIMLSTFDKWGMAVQRRIRRDPAVGSPIQLSVIGRTRESSDFVVDVPSISRPHAAIGYDLAAGWVICDLGSTNGTLVPDGKFDEWRPVGKDWAPISGKKIRLGDHEVRLSRLFVHTWLEQS